MRVRMVVFRCDAPGCDQRLEIPADLGDLSTRVVMAAHGWRQTGTGRRATHTCPYHGEVTSR